MAKCEVCGKSVLFGHRISHSHKVSKKIWHPNIQKVRTEQNGKIRRIAVCTSCLKAGKVKKA